MKQRVSLNVNGSRYELTVWPSQTLLETLRENLQIIGTKEGCGEGECGACTVLLDSKPVNSCLVLAVEADGAEIVTIEGLSDNGNVDPIQEAFIEKGAVQCGFCTPGFIMSAKALLDQNPQPTVEEIMHGVEEIMHGITGNLCRCTGYKQIIDAIQDASRKLSKRVDPDKTAAVESSSR
jgi:carbon-monoxide dehydrogenase small subunit